jgi:PilZ domain
MLGQVQLPHYDSEKRGAMRQRCLLRGRLAFNLKSSTLDCTVRNISKTGARLVFNDPVALPHEFELFIEAQGATYKARLVWSNGSAAGIRFL